MQTKIYGNGYPALKERIKRVPHKLYKFTNDVFQYLLIHNW